MEGILSSHEGEHQQGELIGSESIDRRNMEISLEIIKTMKSLKEELHSIKDYNAKIIEAQEEQYRLNFIILQNLN